MEIYITRNGETLGPYPDGEVREMVGKGMLLPMDLAWSEQTSEWQPLYKIAGIITLSPVSHSNLPPPMATAPPVHVATETAVWMLSQKTSTGITEQDIMLYAGLRNRHYVKAWQNYDAPSLFKRISGNLGFLVASFVWLFYRKMYRLGTLVAIVAVTLTLLEKHDIVAPSVLLFVYAAIAVTYLAFSIYFVDRIYLQRAEEVILEIKSHEKNSLRQQALIKKAGGTRPLLAIALFFLVCFAPIIWDASIQYVSHLKVRTEPDAKNVSAPSDINDIQIDRADAEMIAMLQNKLGYTNVMKLDGMPSRFCGRRTVIAAQTGNDAVIKFPAGTSPVFDITTSNLGIDGHSGTIRSVFSGEKSGVQYVFAVGNDNKYSAFWAADANLRSAYPGADCTFQIIGNPDVKSILSQPIRP